MQASVMKIHLELMYIDLTLYTVFVPRIRFQPALVRYDGFLLFAVGDPNNVLSSRFIQS
jgi:hypothetical protein